MRLPYLIPALLVSLALTTAGCGNQGQDKRNSAAGSTTPATTETTTQADTAPKEVSKDLKTKPQIPTPSGDPPTKLQSKDIVVGKGKAAKKGDKVSVQYVGVAYSTGQEFDASWDRGSPFDFTIGQGGVIKGWDQGVPGMKVGGRRELTIPADLAYGPGGHPPAIGPNETLVFVIDLKKIS